MNVFIKSVMLSTILLSVGCATVQPPVDLDNEFWESKQKTVGVIITKPDEAGFYVEGQVGLLDYAIISAATGQLKTQAKTLSSEDFTAVLSDIQKVLAPQGFTAKEVSVDFEAEKLSKFKDPDSKDDMYFAKKDYRALKEKLGVDYLMTLAVGQMGFARGYYGFMPLDAPRAVFNVHGQGIDLETNELVWYENMLQSQTAAGEWDEGPSYPGLTNSYYVALESAKRRIVEELAPVKGEVASSVSDDGAVIAAKQ